MQYRFTAIDLFCGAGGASQGLRQAHYDVLAAIENEPAACETYRRNHPDTMLLPHDIRLINSETLRRTLNLEVGELSVLKACPPCQKYSSLNRSRTTNLKQDKLLYEVTRFTSTFRPKCVLMENVPGLARDSKFELFKSRLRELGYDVFSTVVDACNYGVPQKRKRLILVAIDFAVVKMSRSDYADIFRSIYSQNIEALEAIRGAASHVNDPLHRPRPIQSLTFKRIKAIPLNGTRFDLPKSLKLKCHMKLAGRSATASYGRVPTTGPSATITTRVTSPSCGQFIHPTLDRPLTLREAALLQTFPPDYVFVGSKTAVARQIGNAVPAKLIEVLADRLKMYV